MNTASFLTGALRNGLELRVENGRLRCRAPQGILTPSLQQALSDRKAEIVALLHEGKKHVISSFTQQRLWFLDRLMPDNPFYNVHAALRLSGSLNVAALKQSLDQIVHRHETLRTTFVAIDGCPVQIIAPTLALTLPLVDLGELAGPGRETRVQQLISDEARAPFDLSRGPLLRASLLRLSGQEHILLLTVHHIISDGWSTGVFIRELAALYTAFSTGKPSRRAGGRQSPLGKLPVQYADFAVWQRQWLQGAALEAQLVYWKQQLAAVPAVLELPTDRLRPPIQTFRGAKHSFVLSKTLSEDLKTLSQQRDVTLFMTLLAAFKVLLYRYTGQADIVVGTPIANRSRSELEGLIGFFANTLALRTDLAAVSGFHELLEQVRDVSLGAYAHQDLPFEVLVDELQPERDLSHNPLFQVMFVLQNTPIEAAELPGLTLSLLDAHSQTAKFDLSLSVRETQAGFLAGEIEYNTDLFETATIRRMPGHLQTLLQGIVADPEQRIADLPLLTPAEQRQWLAWHSAETSPVENRCLHELIEIQAQRTPDVIAVVCEEQHLTYRALDRRANQLAHHLRALGVRADVLVGICLERSLEMVVGLLGTLKAGGAYVPLDPTYPKERLGFMLADTKTLVLLTQSQFVDKLPASQAHIVRLDADWETITHEPHTPPVCAITAENLAYVIYTSGSTGRPKGVMIGHRQVQALLHGFEQVAPAGKDLVGTWICPFGFDVSVWECFSTLCFGGTLHILRPGVFSVTEHLAHYLVERRVSSAYIPPALLPDVAGQLEKLPGRARLDRILVGVEPIKQGVLQRYRDLLDQIRVVNGYGPTESTICATFFSFQSAVEPDRRTPIGMAVPAYAVYLADTRLRPVPVGVPSEIVIGGAGLARGYLNRPGLTAQQFIPDPFGKDSGGRLYKTGDMARYLPNGNIEFLGRVDHQVKVRGFRTELGEIEAALGGHPAVRETAVITREDVAGDLRLVAYVVPDAHYSSSAEPAADWQVEQVGQWQRVFDRIYGPTAPLADPTFNIAGWNSSYTDQPIADDEMREWVEHTAARILAQQPRRVLEIGCGTGLLLFRIAPHCSHYCATDFSQTALDYVRQHLGAHRLPQVTLCHRAADDLQDLAADTFDAVILNSVVQYFPSIDYLLRVLETAIELVEPGGFIFIGDVRSLPLLETLHTSVQLQRAHPSLPSAQLKNRVQHAIRQEQELVIAPDFFQALPQRLPPVSHVRVLLKRGRYHNEMTRFRYDVILHVGTDVSITDAATCLDWQEQTLSLPAVRQFLTESKPDIQRVTRVPNSRLLAELKAQACLAGEDRPASAGDLREALKVAPAPMGVDPEDVWALGQELAYDVDISWSDSGQDGCYDVVFRRPKAPMLVWPSGKPNRLEPWSSFANNPLHGKRASQLLPELRNFMKKKLPEHMLPSAIVLLEALPLTPNGKVNRRALPAPGSLGPDLKTVYLAPRNEAERIIATIWGQVLQVDKIGVLDNFFDLGGHSLSILQVHSKLQNAFEQTLSVIDLFKYSTISALAEYLTQARKPSALHAQSHTRAERRRESMARQRQFRQRHRTTRRSTGECDE